MIDLVKIENEVRKLVGRQVSVLGETDQLAQRAGATVRIVVEYTDVDDPEFFGDMQGLTIRFQCESRIDNPDLARELARKLRSGMGAFLEDGQTLLTSGYLLNEQNDEDADRYLIETVFEGATT